MQRVGMDTMQRRYMVLSLLVLLFLYALLRTAWLSDDSYITLRSVDNLVHGYGITWNPGERVQAFTHPLWFFVLSAIYFFTHEAFYTTLMVSIAVSLAAFSLLAFKHPWTPFLPVGLAVLISSKAFVDYATSGLENPLTYFLLILLGLWFLERDRRKVRQAAVVGLIAGLLTLTRMDLVLIVAPALLYEIWRSENKKKALLHVGLGFLPFALWEIFSIIYFGFPFPNTAYAKLNVLIPRLELLRQGAWYFVNSLSWDPLTLVAIALGVFLGLTSRNAKQVSLMIGVLLYLGYALWIGGDFMSGRYFAAPLAACVLLLLERFRKIQPRRAFAAFLVVMALGWLASTPNLLWSPPIRPDWHQWLDSHLIADERMVYFADSSLAEAKAGVQQPHYWSASAGLALNKAGSGIVGECAVGYLGYFAGPQVYVVDYAGLADPLLARIPFSTEPWRIGHYFRTPPVGYMNTVTFGENRIRNRALATYYDALSLIVRGNLFTMERWQAIWKMNTGQYDSLMQRYVHQAGREANPCD
jgi:arabinofuranosyltransferase